MRIKQLHNNCLLKCLLIINTFVLTILFSCNTDTKDYYEGKLVKGKKIDFDLADKVSTGFHHIQVYDSLIFCTNVKNHLSINVFNLEGDLIDIHRFNAVGPDGIGRFKGFYIHNLDSVFLVNHHAFKLYLVNLEGKVKMTYDLRKKDTDIGSIAYITTGSPMFKVDNMLYLPAMPEIEPYIFNYKHKRLLIEVNLQNSKVQYKLGYPTQMRKYFLHGSFAIKYCCYNYEDSLLTISYPPDNNLYAYDVSKQRLFSVSDSESQYVDHIEYPINKPSNSSYERNLFAVQQDFFTSIFYDKYRELYYRFIRKGMSKKDAKKHLQNPRKGFVSDRYIMVYDKDFNLLHEEKMPFLQTSREVFILQDGLYLKGNYENNEDKVFFQQYIYHR